MEPWKKSEADLLELYRKHINSNYVDFLMRLDLAHTVQQSRDATIIDSKGRTYIDFTAGYGVFNLGHNPPSLVKALDREFKSNPLWGRPFLNEPLVHLVEKLINLTPIELDKAFICSTGAEAVDSAIKLARLATKRSKIVAATGSFHGFTIGALSVCGIPSQRRFFEPLLPDIEFVPFNDPKSLEKTVTQETAAVLLEPVQAEIGGEAPTENYLSSARQICDAAGALLIIDEVRTGMGRTGPLLAIEQDHICPDIVVMGKSLAGGIVPIGALLAKGNLWGRFGLSFSMSASSFAGNRLACVAANQVLAILETEKVLIRGQEIGEFLWSEIEELTTRHSHIIERVSGRGLLIGLHFKNSKILNEVVCHSISNGLLVAAAFCNNRCLLIEPPLILTLKEARRGLTILEAACRKTQENNL